MVADDYIHTKVLASVGPFCFLWSCVIRPVPIFVWVLINTNVVVLIKIGAYILGRALKLKCWSWNDSGILYLEE